jgi:very-short-patch-repair endonuclease
MFFGCDHVVKKSLPRRDKDALRGSESAENFSPMVDQSQPVAIWSRGGTQSQPVALDRALARLAGAQHGVVARSQLLDVGFSPKEVTDRLARGMLQSLHHGVYAVGHRALAPHGRWLAAVLACGPDAVLSHRSAAALWDLRPTTRTAVDVIAPRTRHRRSGINLHLPRCLQPEHRTEHNGIPCATVARTLADLGAVVNHTAVERAWHRAEMLGLLDVRAVEQVLGSGHGRHGAQHLRKLLYESRADQITRSELEERLLTLCVDAGLQRPEVNARIEANGTTYEVDFLWRDQRLVAETDGWGPHHTRDAFESDRRRDADLLVGGLRVVRFTWRQITRNPGAVVRTLQALLDA